MKGGRRAGAKGSIVGGLHDIFELDIARLYDRLSPAKDLELVQDRGDMRFDGGFSDIEIKGDLLVQLSLSQQLKHAKLLRSQACQLLGKIVLASFGLAVLVRDISIIRRQEQAPVQGLLDRLG